MGGRGDDDPGGPLVWILCVFLALYLLYIT